MGGPGCRAEWQTDCQPDVHCSTQTRLLTWGSFLDGPRDHLMLPMVQPKQGGHKIRSLKAQTLTNLDFFANHDSEWLGDASTPKPGSQSTRTFIFKSLLFHGDTSDKRKSLTWQKIESYVEQLQVKYVNQTLTVL